MGFTKLDERILQSSIMAENAEIFKVWIAFLAAADFEGIARVSAVYIASCCHLSIETVDMAIEKLSSPDKYSRSLNDEGKRLERIDGGYKLINYLKYRQFTYSMHPEAVKKRRQRDIKGHVETCPGHSASASASPSASASASASENTGFETFWSLYPKKKNKKDAEKAWNKIKSPTETLEKIKNALLWQTKSDQWQKENGQFIPYPASYLNAGAWMDETENKNAPSKPQNKNNGWSFPENAKI